MGGLLGCALGVLSTSAQTDRLEILVLDLRGESGVEDGTVRLLTEMLTTKISESGRLTVRGARDTQTMLGLEAQKQLLGCSDDSCLTELAGAIGTDLLLVSSVGRVGATGSAGVELVFIKALPGPQWHAFYDAPFGRNGHMCGAAAPFTTTGSWEDVESYADFDCECQGGGNGCNVVFSFPLKPDGTAYRQCPGDGGTIRDDGAFGDATGDTEAFASHIADSASETCRNDDNTSWTRLYIR